MGINSRTGGSARDDIEAGERLRGTYHTVGRGWAITTFSALETWRERQRLSKRRVADLLGVTNSTYHNWARGRAVATPAAQQRILDLIRGDAAPQPPARTSGGLRPPVGSTDDGVGEVKAVLDSTAQIMSTFLLETRLTLTPEQLGDLVREVRQALRA